MASTTDALNRIRTARKLLNGRPAPARPAQPIPAPREPVEVHSPSDLRGERLLLRPLRPADRREFMRIAALSRQHLARFCPLHKVGETDAMLFERHLSLTDAAERTGRAWRRVIVLNDGRLAGAVNINDLSRGLEHTGEINWWVSADCLGRGVATEAVRLTTAFALDDLPHGLGLTTLRALITRDNDASRRLASACGFQRQPWTPPVQLNLGGRWTAHDTFVRYATLPQPAPAGAGGPVLACRRLLRAGLASILATEATTLLRARDAAHACAASYRAPALATA